MKPGRRLEPVSDLALDAALGGVGPYCSATREEQARILSQHKVGPYGWRQCMQTAYCDALGRGATSRDAHVVHARGRCGPPDKWPRDQGAGQGEAP